MSLFVNHKISHKTMRLFNAAFGEIARETEILMPHTAGATILMRTGMPYYRHRQIARWGSWMYPAESP